MKVNFNELTKLYPNHKIPVVKHAEYYLDLLNEANITTKIPIQQLKCLQAIGTDVSKYKMKSMDEILKYFKNNHWDLSELPLSSPIFNKEDYTLLDFNNWNTTSPTATYVSIDLKQANWQSFKLAFGLNLPDWETWTKQTFNLHPFIADSKSFRQLLFGNTNPKRLQTIQQEMMKDLLSIFPESLKGFIVSRKSDEIILEFPVFFQSDMDLLNSFLTPNFSVSKFTVSEHLSSNETIKTKNMDNGEAKMINVPGNRYFIHLKNIILKKEIDERDLYFEVDNKLAKWIL
ncbi:MAG: hypothetical protein ABIP51_00485 [Bacteroidia bacterium]